MNARARRRDDGDRSNDVDPTGSHGSIVRMYGSGQDRGARKGRSGIRRPSPVARRNSACSTRQGRGGDIAGHRRRSGPNYASITYYFGSKRDLVDEAMVTAARRLIQPVVAEFADDGRDSITNCWVPSSSSTASSTNM